MRVQIFPLENIKTITQRPNVAFSCFGRIYTKNIFKNPQCENHAFWIFYFEKKYCVLSQKIKSGIKNNVKHIIIKQTDVVIIINEKKRFNLSLFTAIES